MKLKDENLQLPTQMIQPVLPTSRLSNTAPISSPRGATSSPPTIWQPGEAVGAAVEPCRNRPCRLRRRSANASSSVETASMRARRSSVAEGASAFTQAARRARSAAKVER